MRCPKCYYSKNIDERTNKYPQMKRKEDKGGVYAECPVCGYTLREV